MKSHLSKPESRGIRIRRNWWQIILEVCQGRQKNWGKQPGRFDGSWVSTNPRIFFFERKNDLNQTSKELCFMLIFRGVFGCFCFAKLRKSDVFLVDLLCVCVFF